MKNKHYLVGNVVVIELVSRDKKIYYAQIDPKRLAEVNRCGGTWRLYRYKDFLYARHSDSAEMLHRFLMEPGAGYRVVHKNGDTLNCTAKNMTVVPALHSEQTPTGKPVGLGPETTAELPKVSGIKGVTFHKNSSKWAATVFQNGKRHCLKYHDTPEQAAAAIEKFKEEQGG